MRKNNLGSLLASTAVMRIPMSPVERQMGRLMRSPDDHAAAPTPSPTPAPAPAAEAAPAEPDFAAFEKAAMSGEELPAAEAPPAKKEGEEAPAADADEDAGEGNEGEIGEEAPADDKPKGPKSAKDRIRELNAKVRATEAAMESQRRGFEARMERLEKGLPAAPASDSNTDEAVAPDPTDLDKYPLGILDDRYQEDKLVFLADQTVKEQLGSLLQREQQQDQQAESERIAQALQEQAETLASKGAEIFDDFDEVVVKAAMAGDFDLDQPTFEACAEAPHGAEILHILASDKAEAARVAKLSSFQQTKYVLNKNSEIAGGKPPAPKKIPGAETQPADTVRGQGARQTVTADTTDFAQFEAMAMAKK